MKRHVRDQQCLQRILFRDKTEVVRIEMKPCWAWKSLPVIPALGKLKQDDPKFEDTLDSW